MSMIRSLGYLRIESPDPGAWREFGVRDCKNNGVTPEIRRTDVPSEEGTP
jgi:hypothetical protein